MFKSYSSIAFKYVSFDFLSLFDVKSKIEGVVLVELFNIIFYKLVLAQQKSPCIADGKQAQAS